MKRKVFRVLVFCLVLTVCRPAFGGTLINRTIKDINSETATELATFNASSFQSIRIAIDNLDERSLSRTDYGSFRVEIYAADEPKDFLIAASEADVRFMSMMDVPPARVRILIRGKGKFRLLVWGV